MFDYLTKQFLRNYFPPVIGLFLWYMLIYWAVADEAMSRYVNKVIVPRAIEQTRARLAYQDIKMSSADEAEASKYIRCLYDRLRDQDGFKRDYAMYLASLTFVTGSKVLTMRQFLDTTMNLKVCGPRPWIALAKEKNKLIQD